MDSSIIAQLKQINVSVDPEKTKARTNDLWKSISTTAQKEVLEFLGLKVTSIYRAYKTGNISAKIIVALAQICDINPYYLTGESDEQSGSSEEILKQFLIDKGYHKLFGVHPQSRRRGKKRESIIFVPEPEKDTEQQNDLPESSQSVKMLQDDIAASIIESFLSKYDQITSEQLENMQNLSLEDIDTLIKALLIRAKTMNKSATIETLIKLLLIS